MNVRPIARVDVVYFSDLLCVWAYVAQVKLDELRSQFGPSVAIESRLLTVFGDTQAKIGGGWKDRDGFEGYAHHVAEVAERFPHVSLHPDTWLRTRPASSVSVHVVLKALQGACDAGELPSQQEDGAARPSVEELAWQLRLAFFAEGRDVGERSVQLEVAESMGLPVDAIERRIADGRAFAALASDEELQRRHGVQGSPTWLLNGGRQRLYGNVGYRVVDANVRELLREPASDDASWC